MVIIIWRLYKAFLRHIIFFLIIIASQIVLLAYILHLYIYNIFSLIDIFIL